DATIFHAKSERWLPISSHPAFRLAMASMPMPSPVPIVGERSASSHTALVAPSPLYAEPRRQASRGAEGLGRPEDARSDFLVLVLASLLVLGMVVLAVQRPFAVPSHGSETAEAAAATLTFTRVTAPGSLARHHADREDRLVNLLNDRLRLLATARPLLPAAVDTPQILEQALVHLREARDTIAVFRRRAVVLDRVYADSSGRVGQVDAAPLAPLLAEPDSSYALAQSLTVLLLAARERYQGTADTVTFERVSEGAEYSRLLAEYNEVLTGLRSNPRFSMLPPPLPALPPASSSH
ncbi:MAG: hypothetical protein ABJC74_01745, partial [Gemmatimonadota bacterium]